MRFSHLVEDNLNLAKLYGYCHSCTIITENDKHIKYVLRLLFDCKKHKFTFLFLDLADNNISMVPL